MRPYKTMFRYHFYIPGNNLEDTDWALKYIKFQSISIIYVASQKFWNRTITQVSVWLLQLYKNGENKV